MDASNVYTKVLESKENPFASAHGKSSVQGSVVTIILSRPDGTEIPVQHTAKPISIRLTRPAEKRPKYQAHKLTGTSLQYHRVSQSHGSLQTEISPSSSSSS